VIDRRRILAGMGLAAVAALGLALATVFAVLAIDRGDLVYIVATPVSFAVAVVFCVAVFAVANGRKRWS
jgi:hypothetical protein